MYIPNYTSSTNKSISFDIVSENNATLAYATLEAWLWSQTAAITSIGFTGLYGGSIASNSTFSLYGLAAVGTTPVIAPKASGGNVIATDGTYWYHAFLANGTFTPQTGLSADVLVVAGGGGAGDFYGAGGGGGGLLAFTSQSLTATNYTCTVGAGGAAGVNSNGTVGADSQFAALTLVKGGGFGGGGGGGVNGGTGGSGGGAASGSGSASATGGSATSGQGNAGGNAGSAGQGGGGGAGGAGASNSGTVGGAGGAGSSTYGSWGSATGLGYSQNSTFYFAGGGAGSGVGGNGGQANGSTAISTAGQANTGQGGGADGTAPSFLAYPGGSGIVIIRYLAA
jgi:hypothetical protein